LLPGQIYGIHQCQDGNLLAAGETYSNVYPPDLRPEDNPVIRWNSDLLFDLANVDCAVFGQSNFPRTGYLSKIAPNGDIVWTTSLTAELSNSGYTRGSNIFDVVEVNGLSGTEYWAVGLGRTYVDPSATACIYRIDANGVLLGVQRFKIGESGTPSNWPISNDSFFYSIAKDDLSGKLFITGAYFPPSGPVQSVGMLVDPLLPGNEPLWFKTTGDVGGDLVVNGGHEPTAVNYTTGGGFVNSASTRIVWPILGNYTFGDWYSGRKQASLWVHGYDIDGTWRWKSDLGTVRAYDLQSDMVATSDGNVAIVCTKWDNGDTGASTDDGVFNGNDLPESSFDCLVTDFGYTAQGSGGFENWSTSDKYDYWNTDAFVAKLKSDDGSMVWCVQWDADPYNNFECFPGDLRNQECMYKITEAPDGGLVVCGNTSHNFDDYYLTKLGSDCQSSFNYANLPLSENGVHVVQGTALWNSDIYVYGTIVIPNGSTLNIQNCIVRFADTKQLLHPTRIIVEAGGRLIVNNATLTSIDACPNSMWDGIQLRGDEFAGQGSGTTGLDQGYLSLKNATITNARIGVNLASVAFNPPVNPKIGERSGGILIAYDSRFINNVRDVTFSPYENFANNTPGQILPNRSTFIRCTFATEGPLNVASLYPKEHVVLSMVRGIQFRGCTFSNALVGTQYQLTSHQGTGIHSLNSSFVVRNDCSVLTQVGQPCPVENTTTSSFVNLHRGVLATTFDLSRTFSVTDARFDRVNFGIRMEGVQDAAINRNTFDVAEPFVPGLLGPTYGIYSDQCTGYSIQENSFTTSSPSGLVKKVGLVIKDSGPYYNTFYNNSFERLYTGSIIQGRNADTDANNIPGLEVKCNDYGLTSQNTFDVALTGDNVRVQKTQGGPYDPQNTESIRNPAGNRFSVAHNGTGNPQEDWHVQVGSNLLDYFHHTPNTGNRTLPQYRSSLVTPSDQNVFWPGKSVACPTMVDDGGTKPVKRLAATAHDDEYAEQAEAYDAAKDDGDTYSLLSYVSDPTHNSTQVRNALQSVAPKVGTEVWQAAFERSIPMSAWHMTQALLSNSPLQSEVLRMVEVYGLPTYYANLIYNAQSGEVNILTLLESGMAYHAGLKADALHDLGQLSWLDSLDLPNSVDSLLLFHADLPSDNSGLEQSAVLTATKQYSTLETLAEQSALTSSSPELYQVIKRFAQRQQDLGWDEVNGDLVSWLSQLGTQREVEGSAPANAWLHALGSELPDEVIILPEDGAKRMGTPRSSAAVDWANEFLLEAFPNPSNGPVFLAYTLPEGSVSGTILIAELSGREVARQNAYQESGILQVPTSGWSAGLYLVTLHADGQQIQVKLSVTP
jgi:hypothetical protein